MANEAVFLKINEFANAVGYTCASGKSISKGTLLVFNGNNTVGHSTAVNLSGYAGVAAMDKDGTDSSTSISVYPAGQGHKFTMRVDGHAVIAGQLAALSGNNTVRQASSADISNGRVIGKFETTTADGSDATVLS